MTNVEHMLGLTRQALDEFESVPLAASLRRALRIARLRGDIHYVHMFQLDLGPHGGSTVWRRTEAFELLKSEEISTVDVDWWRSQINEEWMKERTPSKVHELLKDAFGHSDLIGGSIESIIRNSAALERRARSRRSHDKNTGWSCVASSIRRSSSVRLTVSSRTCAQSSGSCPTSGSTRPSSSGTGCAWSLSCRRSHRGCSNSSRPRTGAPGKTMPKARRMRSPRVAESSSRSRT